MTSRSVIAAVAVAGLLALPGCGGKSEDDKAKETMTEFMAAIGRGDGKKACGLADESGRQRLVRAARGRLSCEELVARIATRLPADVKIGLQNAEVRKIAVDGDTAKIRDSDIKSSKGDVSSFLTSDAPTTLVKRGGDWKVSGE